MKILLTTYATTIRGKMEHLNTLYWIAKNVVFETMWTRACVRADETSRPGQQIHLTFENYSMLICSLLLSAHIFFFPWCKHGPPREPGSHSLSLLMYINAHIPLLALPLLRSLTTAKISFIVSKSRMFRRRFMYASTVFTPEYFFFIFMKECQQAVWKDRNRKVVKHLHSYLFYSN